MNGTARLVIALLAGVVVGGGGAAVLASVEPATGDSATPPVTATTAPPIVTEAPWIEGGARFRSSVVVPQAFVVGEGRAELEFQIVPLHWTVDPGEEPHPDELPVRPELWELTTNAGTVYEAATTVIDDVVRFEVPDELEATDVADVRIVRWRLAAPVGNSVTIPISTGERRTLPDGATIEIDTVLEQATSTIVQMDSKLADTSWLHDSRAPVVPADPGWRVSFRFNQSSNMQLSWEDVGAPTQLDLVQAYPEWVPLVADTVVVGRDR